MSEMRKRSVEENCTWWRSGCSDSDTMCVIMRISRRRAVGVTPTSTPTGVRSNPIRPQGNLSRGRSWSDAFRPPNQSLQCFTNFTLYTSYIFYSFHFFHFFTLFVLFTLFCFHHLNLFISFSHLSVIMVIWRTVGDRQSPYSPFYPLSHVSHLIHPDPPSHILNSLKYII